MTTENTEDDVFANMFSQLSAGKTPEEASAASAPAEDPPADDNKPAIPNPTEASAEPAPSEEPKSVEDPAPESAPAVEHAQSTTQDSELAALRAQIAALEAREAERSKAVETKPEPAPAPVSLYSDDETARMKKYEEEWPDIAKGEELKRRQEYNHLVEHIFKEVRNYLAPVMETVDRHSTDSTYAQLTARVSDYDEVVQKIPAWIESQPTFLKEAYSRVANEGSVADVVDMINRYKKETGAQTAAPAAAPAAPAQKAMPTIAPAAKKAAASLKVVQSSQSSMPQGSDPMDFDAAFAEATKQG